MLHMLVNTHSEDSCAFRNDENRQILMDGFNALEGAASANGAKLLDIWVNMASHTVFALFDAPNAHTVDELLRQAGLVGFTRSQVYAVEPMQTAMAAVES